MTGLVSDLLGSEGNAFLLAYLPDLAGAQTCEIKRHLLGFAVAPDPAEEGFVMVVPYPKNILDHGPALGAADARRISHGAMAVSMRPQAA